MSAGKKLRQAIAQNQPLKIVGTINAYSALMAEKLGHQAIYLSGGGVAACSMAVPDLGISELNDVLIDAQRITNASSLPLLVDIDTGWGGAFNIAKAIRAMEKAGVAGVHIEDQVLQKRCGHRPNKAVVSQEEMVDRIKAAVDARQDESFMIMARTDAFAVEGMDAAIERALACIEAGADAIFPEALSSLDHYRTFSAKVKLPILANITEFGKTPLFGTDELYQAGARMVLYPLTAFRAMSKAAEQVYRHLLEHPSQQALLDTLQTRDELYHYLDYYAYEQKLDQLFSQK